MNNSLNTVIECVQKAYPIVKRILFSYNDTKPKVCRWDGHVILNPLELAHAHNDRHGVICIVEYQQDSHTDSLWDFYNQRPTTILLHEIAHLVAIDDYYHGLEWANAYNRLRREWGYPQIINPDICS